MSDPKTIRLPAGLVEQQPAYVPDTPAGQKLTAFLAVFNSANREALIGFMAEHFAPPALQGQEPEERTLWALSLHRDTGGFKLGYVVGLPRDLEIAAYAQTELTGEWFLIQLDVSEEPPHPILKLTTRISQRPADAGPHPSLHDDEMIARLKALLERLVQADMFSGALMVTRGDRSIFEYVCGQASQAYDIPNRIDTKFNVGSMCKSFTAVAVAQLAEQGLLSFEDPLIRFLPDYPAKVAEKITLHHLLTHTSGLAHYWNARFEASRAKLRRVSDYMPLFIDDPLAFEPGTQYSYSNAGYILLGAVIEAVSGQDYFDYMREYVYQPAGMIDTDAFEMDRSTPNLATGYTFNGLDDRPELGPRRNNLFMHVVKGGPAGGAFSTVRDLFQFSQALLGYRLLGEEMTETVISSKVRIGRGVEKQYGYGFMITYVNGRRIVGHSGTFPGIGARLDMYLDHDYTVEILSNYDPYITQAIGNRIREWIAGY